MTIDGLVGLEANTVTFLKRLAGWLAVKWDYHYSTVL